LIQQQMERTRGSLTEKLEVLEGQVAETVSSTAGAVQDTTQTVQETVTGAVDAVKDTVAAVTDKVQETMESVTDKFQETVQAVTETFDLSIQMRRHPWLVLGGAVAVGCLVGSSFGAEDAEDASEAKARGSSPPPPPPPWSPRAEKNEQRQGSSEGSGMWHEAMSHVKDIGVSFLMGLIRDLAQRGLPDGVGERIAKEVDSLTTKLGTEPIPGPVLPEVAPASESDTDSGNRPENAGRRTSGYRGRAPATATAY